jgi:hypothetical protein
MRIWLIVLAISCTIVASAADKPGAIKARGKPGGAGLFVDGKYLGPAGRFTVPEKYTVEPGDHEVTLRDPRYEDYTTKVTVQAGKTAKISYKLKPVEVPPPPYGRLRFGGDGAESFLSVTSGDTGPVYINGKFYGFIDELNNAGGGLLLPPGTYELRLEPVNFQPVNQPITIEANKVTVVPLKQR